MNKLSDEHWRHLYDAADGKPVYPGPTDKGAQRGVLTKLRRTLAQYHAVDSKTGTITDIGRRLLQERAEKGLGRPGTPAPAPAGPLFETPNDLAHSIAGNTLRRPPLKDDDPRVIIEAIRDLPEDQLHPWDAEFRRLWCGELAMGLPGQEAPGVAFAFAENENGPRPKGIVYAAIGTSATTGQPPSNVYAGPPVPPAPYTLRQALADLESFCFALSMHHGTSQAAAHGIRLYLKHFENYGFSPSYPGDPTRHRAAVMMLCLAKAPEIPQSARLGPKQRRFLFGHYQAAIVMLVSDDPLHETPWARYTTDALDGEVQTALLDHLNGRLRIH